MKALLQKTVSPYCAAVQPDMIEQKAPGGSGDCRIVAPGSTKDDRTASDTASNSDSLVGPTIKAFAWRFLSEASTFTLKFMLAVVLARLLPVDAFGLLAVAMVVINFCAKMSYMGMAQAIIQARDLTETHIRVAFSLSVLSGAVLTTAVWAGAPLLAAAFRADAAGPVLRLMSFWFLCAGFGATASGILQRKLDYRRLLWIALVSNIFGYAVVTLTLAILGYGVWALAWGMVAESVLSTSILLWSSPHPFKPSLSGPEARTLLNFGVGLTLSSFANYAAVNGDNFVVSRWLGTVALGLYARAFQLMTLPLNQVASVISYVLFPVYSIIQNDTARLRRAYLSSVSLSSIAIYPILVGMAIGAPEILGGVFGPEWLGAVVPLQILCVGGAFHCMYNLADSLARAKGAVYLKFWYHTIYASCVIVGSIIGRKWGVAGVAVGVVASLSVIYLLLGRLSIRLTQASWRLFFVAQLPGMAIGAGVASVAFPATLLMRAAHLPQLFILACTVVICLTAAVATAVVLPREWLNRATFGALSSIRNNAAVRSAIRRADHFLKAYLRRNRTLFHIALVPLRLYENALLARHTLRQGLWRNLVGFRRAVFRRAGQKETVWRLPLPGFERSREFISWLRSQAVNVKEGAHAFYIPPQERLGDLIPAVTDFYPPGSGFKILKDFRDPARARYLYVNRSLFLLSRLIGTPRDQVAVANYLHWLGLGPRVWDLTCWEAHGRRYTVFVVDHVEGKTPTSDQSSSFLDELSELDASSDLRILLPNWKQNEDFTPPDCKHNLIYSELLRRAFYVDFQNFSLTSPDVWLRRVIADSDGERFSAGAAGFARRRSGVTVATEQTSTRWSLISKALGEASICLNGRIVLDIGSKSAVRMHSCLAHGAAWVFGWFEPECTEGASNLLLSLGATRFAVYAANHHPKYEFQNDIPDRFQRWLPESVVCCLGSSDELEPLSRFQTMPWSVLIYERELQERYEDSNERQRLALAQRPGILNFEYAGGDSKSDRRMSVFIRRKIPSLAESAI